MSSSISATQLPEAARGLSAQKQILTFQLEEDAFGIELPRVVELIDVPWITEVPDMPRYLKGVINLRGRIFPVIDLRLRFGLPERVYDEKNCLIVIKVGAATTGLIVDRIGDVYEICQTEIELPARERSYSCGTAKIGGYETELLCLEELLIDENLPREETCSAEALQEALTHHSESNSIDHKEAR